MRPLMTVAKSNSILATTISNRNIRLLIDGRKSGFYPVTDILHSSATVVPVADRSYIYSVIKRSHCGHYFATVKCGRKLAVADGRYSTSALVLVSTT